MLLPERRNAILEHLRRTGSARISELVGLLGVSDVTVRRDVDALEREGGVQRFYGGVTLARRSTAESARPASEVSRALRLGLLIPDIPYYKEVLAGAKEMAASLKAQVTLAFSHYAPEADLAAIHTLVRDQVDGLLLAPAPDQSGHAQMADDLCALSVPVVLIERRLRSETLVDRLDHVVSDHQSGARIAVEHLVSLGHRRIGVVSQDTGPTSPHLLDGYRHAVHALGLESGPILSVPQIHLAERNPRQHLQQALATLRQAGATATLAHGDKEALTLTQIAHELGVRIPRDLSVVSYDDDLASFAAVPLTAIAPPKRALGSEGVQMLVARLRGGAERPVRHITLQPRLVVRESCGTRTADTP